MYHLFQTLYQRISHRKFDFSLGVPGKRFLRKIEYDILLYYIVLCESVFFLPI
jgi:hypothetical protein